VSRVVLLIAMVFAVLASACGLSELIAGYSGGAGGAPAGGSGGFGGHGGGDGGSGAACPDPAVVFERRASFTTQSEEFQEILALDLPGAAAPNGWIALLSARLTSETSQAESQEVRYLVDGVVRGIGQTRSESNAPLGGGPWHSFDWIAPASGDRRLAVEFRNTRAQFLATIEDLQVVAFAVPDDADLTFVDQPQIADVVQPSKGSRLYQPVATLEIVPPAPGDYLVMLGVVANEAPGVASVGIRAVAPGSDVWPVESAVGPRPYLSNAIDEWVSFTLVRSLPSRDGSALSVDLQIDASSATATTGSQIQFVRALALRHDSFGAVNIATAPAEVPVSATRDTAVGELELAAANPCHRRVVAQFVSLHGEGGRRARFPGAGVDFDHLMTVSETKLVYGAFAAVGGEATTLTTFVATSDAAIPINVRESVILALDVPGTHVMSPR
jgi:hypothetical protein